jgi:hypothetical protein
VYDAEQVWQRIVRHAGEEFRLIGGRPFTYEVRGPRTLLLHATPRNMSRASIERALERWPVEGPGGLRGINAASFVWRILADRRVLGR